MVRITFRNKTYEVRAGESVLDALVRGGANVAFSCRRGSCHTCMLRAVSGAPGAASQRTLRAELAESGHFLPCVCTPQEPLALEPADTSRFFLDAVVGRIERKSARVLRLGLEPERALHYRPGQYVNLRRTDGVTRSYSLRGFTDEDYFLELDVQRVPGGVLSTWIHEELREGDVVQVQGPLGTCCYDESMQGQPLILAGTGTGIAPLHGIVRDALRSGHSAPIHLYYGARRTEDLYAHDELSALAAHGVRYHAVVLEGEPPAGHRPGNLADLVFTDHPDVCAASVFLCGDPELVQRLRGEAIGAGALRERIHVDPFESAGGAAHAPRDAEIIATTQPDPAIWAALGHGPGLRAILEDFYEQVYADARLAPFFHGVTKERAISKQYEFLADMFSGSKNFFGLKPFNAHHWMVISDELFDYREALFESVLRRHALPEPVIRRWLRFHELFRLDLVKASARGLFVDGVEHLKEGFCEELLSVDSLCDGCGGEMRTGSTGRLHRRTGKLYCGSCRAQTLSPPAGS